MANFIERIAKINELASHLLAQGKAKDAAEANRMAEEIYGGADMADFNRVADRTVRECQEYGDRVRKNGMKQPRSPQS